MSRKGFLLHRQRKVARGMKIMAITDWAVSQDVAQDGWEAGVKHLSAYVRLRYHLKPNLCKSYAKEVMARLMRRQRLMNSK